MQRRWILVSMLAGALCVTAPACDQAGSAPFTDHSEAADFEPLTSGKADGIAATFEPSHIVDDVFFSAVDAVTTQGLQAFFESTPYGHRSWLADAWVDGQSAAATIVAASTREGINPILMVARMQIEQGLVSRTERPADKKVDFAFGCGCPDSTGCQESFRGLDKQVACAAETMRKLFFASRDGTGLWRRDVARTTLDHLSITPATHGTAALYAYTPWVLEGQGGNWLVWNITRKFYAHFRDHGLLNISAADLEDPWVGTPCSFDARCQLEGQDAGYCHVFDAAPGNHSGYCALPCDGYCPDQSGHAWTFCVSLDGGDTGSCVPQSKAENDYCDALAFTEPTEMERFVGTSGATPTSRTVCVPDLSASSAVGSHDEPASDSADSAEDEGEDEGEDEDDGWSWWFW